MRILSGTVALAGAIVLMSACADLSPKTSQVGGSDAVVTTVTTTTLSVYEEERERIRAREDSATERGLNFPPPPMDNCPFWRDSLSNAEWRLGMALGMAKEMSQTNPYVTPDYIASREADVEELRQKLVRIVVASGE